VAATLAISGAPIATGNMGITDGFALFVESGAIGLNHAQKIRGKTRLVRRSSISSTGEPAVANTLIVWRRFNRQHDPERSIVDYASDRWGSRL